MREEELYSVIVSADSIQEAVAILNENGYSVDEEMLLEYECGNEIDSKTELSEDELHNISGGSVSVAIRNLLNKLKGKQMNGQKQGSSGGWHISAGRHG